MPEPEIGKYITGVYGASSKGVTIFLERNQAAARANMEKLAPSEQVLVSAIIGALRINAKDLLKKFVGDSNEIPEPFKLFFDNLPNIIASLQYEPETITSQETSLPEIRLRVYQG